MEGYVLFNCPGCGDYTCVAECKPKAMAFFYGNIMAETAKCEPCPRFKSGLFKKGLKEGLPPCALKCGKSKGITLISVPCVEEKRSGAAEGLGVMGLSKTKINY